MKNKRWMIAVMAVLMVLTAQPLVSFASDAQPGFDDMDVICVVNPVYEFSIPPDVTIRYPNTSVTIGQFGVGDLLLPDGEQLSIELVPGSMDARGTGGALPYSVSFNPPPAIDASNIGQAYDVVVTIDSASFQATRRPYHDATLLFRVRSLLTGEVIWQGTTTVTARRTPVGQGGGDTGDNGGNGGNVVVPDTGDNTIPGEEVPQGGQNIEGNNGQTGENMSDEEAPEAQTAADAFWWWWIPLAALAALLLILLLLLWYNVSVTVYGKDSAGQEKALRSIRRLKRKRKEVIVPLSSRQVRGGVGGVVELTRGFTRRMRGEKLTVEVDGVRQFSTTIPADGDYKFTARIDNWIA